MKKMLIIFSSITCLFVLFIFVFYLLVRDEIALIDAPVSPETACEDIPTGSIVFAPAFDNLGQDENGKYRPGKANEALAAKLEACAARFKLVMTQKAVSDALLNPEQLKNGVPVYQMHRDGCGYINTMQAFQCALARFENPPDQIVLLAHPRHIERAFFVLSALYPTDKIIKMHLGQAVYEDESGWRAWRWALKNSVAWRFDRRKVHNLRNAKEGSVCPEKALLPKIVN
jgi:hypothetical protein